jgi:hypothetical protein
MMLSVLSAWHGRHTQIVIVGESRESQRELLSALATVYQPFSLVVPVTSGERQQELAKRMAFIGGMRPRDGRAAAYVCRNFACRQPVTTAEDLRAELTADAGS